MAKSKSSVSKPSVKAEAVSRSTVCGDCDEAYGFCWPVLDGSPYFCRCPFHPWVLRRTEDPSCHLFKMSATARPARAAVHLSECMGGPEPEKVVPLFREGERRPWKLVSVSEIPVGGISWDGTPAKDNQQGQPETEEDLVW